MNFSFINYDLVKLDIANPDLCNVILILLFSSLVVVTLKKDPLKSAGEFFSVSQTDQLRGVGIFFVVLGHLWVHVSKIKAQLVFSGDAVALFLILSGFGLTISVYNKNISFKDFCCKRINRVMLPYWVATVIILILDYHVLGRTLGTSSLLMTFAGINTSIGLRHLDYVRWFVTFILMWYLVYYIVFIRFKSKYSSIIIIAFSIFLLPLDYYLLHFGWYQFISFPVGCLLAIKFDMLSDKYKKNINLVRWFSVLGLIYAVTYKILYTNEKINPIIINIVPNILLKYLHEVNSVIVSMSIVFLLCSMFRKGYRSYVLLLLGKYSYEIFLIHGIFLIKYNQFINANTISGVTVQFVMFFLFVICVSAIMSKIVYLLNKPFAKKREILSLEK